MSLTPKQQRFVEEYPVDLNATQAAIRAGYAESGARTEGARLLANANVQEELSSIMQKRSAQTGIDAHWVLKRLGDEAEADLADLYDESGSLRPVHEWPLIWRQGLVAGVETVRVKGGDDELASFVDKVKLADRAKRLEMLGRHVDVSAFKDQVAHTHNLDPETAEWLGLKS